MGLILVNSGGADASPLAYVADSVPYTGASETLGQMPAQKCAKKTWVEDWA